MIYRAPEIRSDQLAIAVHTLNRRWGKHALAIWQGHRPAASPELIYNGFESVLTPEMIAATETIPDSSHRLRIRHGLIDHYLQRELMPHETEMQAWSRGAAAHVDGEKIYFRDIIPWCQKSSTLAKRQKLQQETSPLCKLLRPFAVNYWDIVLKTLTNTLGFDGYINYCQSKKGIDYHHLYQLTQQMVHHTDGFYYNAMEAWCQDRFRVPLDHLTRFDAMNLLSLSQWDHLCPVDHVETTLDFFNRWEIDPAHHPGLYLDIDASPAKSAQAITMIIAIPDEIHLLMRPEGGWGDLETLWHELGHGLSAVFTDPSLPLVDRELATAFNLSEVYAFLLQRMVLSRPVLEALMDLPESVIDTIGLYKDLKDLSVFRRYAAKFISEYEMFRDGDISDGVPYADTMARITGFYHQPESHLFDLVPEFYCADYLLGWIGEALLEQYLQTHLGRYWCMTERAGKWLKGLWQQGNQLDIDSFFRKNDMGELAPTALLNRWDRLSGRISTTVSGSPSNV
ncbi:uncharacterized protein Dvar_71330 [Desulfosarcina variabilis str. Montpellier]|uniref:hypothetical protein n=1 Tax=Desulfosarcina variabilis TaxID=2300 RepID=UPI003AFA5726